MAKFNCTEFDTIREVVKNKSVVLFETQPYYGKNNSSRYNNQNTSI